MTGINTDGMIVIGPVHSGYRRILADTEPPHQPIRYRQLADSLEGTITSGIDTHNAGKGTVLSVYDLCDERDIALKDLVTGFLIDETTRGLVGRTTEHEISAMLCGRSCRGGGLVLVRQSFVDVGYFPCLHFIQ